MTPNSRADELSLFVEPSVANACRVTLVTILVSALAISAFTLLLRWRLTPQLALVAAASSGVALVLSRSGRIKLAMMLPLLSITYAVLHSAVRTEGIGSIGLVMLPVLIVVGSLVLDRLTLVLFAAGTILAVAGMLAIRYFVTEAERYSTNDMGDLFIFALTCATAAVVGRLFASRIKEGFSRVREYCQALGRAERNVRLVADSLTEMVAAYDMHRNLTYVNSGAEKLTGYGLAELQAAAPLLWTHPEDRPQVLALWDKVFDGQKVDQVVYRLMTKDGNVRWVAGSWGPVTDEAGQLVGIRGTCQDITERVVAERSLAETTQKFWTIVDEIAERKRAEATLRESEERLRTSERQLIEAQRLARVGSWERYFEGDAIYWSDEMFRIFGLSIGTPLHFQTFLRYVHPEDREGIVEANQKARTTKAPVIVEYRITRPDGELRFIRSVVEVVGSDDPNAPIRMAGATQDITEQVKAGEQLRESEERLRSAQRLARFGNWEWDIKTNHIFRSEEICRIFGMPPSSSTTDYTEFLQAVQPQDRDRLVQAARDALAEEKSSWFLEFQITRPDGEVRTVACVAEVFRDAAGSPVRMGGACQDVTDQKYAEAHLRRSLDEIAHLNRVAAMGELTGSLAHELNQPLAAILSNAQAASRFLDREYPDRAEVKECLTDIIADDKRAGEVIRRLRSLLKKGASQPSLVDLNEVVSDAIRLVGNDAMLRNVSVKVEPFPGLAAVLGDRIQLYQLALNLIMNGLDAVAERSPGNRWVLVRTAEADGGGVELRVEDSGKGIAEGDLVRVFEPFYTTKPDGLGMGLSISRSIVQAHGGRIWADSRAGGGAIFRCVLPAPQQTVAAAAR